MVFSVDANVFIKISLEQSSVGANCIIYGYGVQKNCFQDSQTFNRNYAIVLHFQYFKSVLENHLLDFFFFFTNSSFTFFLKMSKLRCPTGIKRIPSKNLLLLNLTKRLFFMEVILFLLSILYFLFIVYFFNVLALVEKEYSTGKGLEVHSRHPISDTLVSLIQLLTHIVFVVFF